MGMYKWLTMMAKASPKDDKATRSSLIREAVITAMEGPWRKIVYSNEPLRYVMVPVDEDPVEVMTKAIKIIKLLEG